MVVVADLLSEQTSPLVSVLGGTHRFPCLLVPLGSEGRRVERGQDTRSGAPSLMSHKGGRCAPRESF